MFIYVVVNSETLKIYIGQHTGDNLGKYLSKKFWDANHHTSGTRSHIYASMRKYPRESWSIHPLISGIESKAELDEAERLLIYALKTQHPDVGYNICDGGEGHPVALSAESLLKVGLGNKAAWARYTPEQRAARGKSIGDGLRGIPKSRESVEKTRRFHLGRKQTPEHIAKRAEKARNPSDATRAKFSEHAKTIWASGRQAAHVESLRGIPRPAHVIAAFHSPEARAKAGAAQRGKILAPENIAGISDRKTKWWADHPDHKFSADRNAKISAARKGHAPLEALKLAHSPETEAKRSLTRFLKTVAWG